GRRPPGQVPGLGVGEHDRLVVALGDPPPGQVVVAHEQEADVRALRAVDARPQQLAERGGAGERKLVLGELNGHFGCPPLGSGLRAPYRTAIQARDRRESKLPTPSGSAGYPIAPGSAPSVRRDSSDGASRVTS